MDTSTTAAPAATQPEALRLALDVLREMLSDPDQRLDQCPARMARANQAARALAGVQAPPAAQEAEPATGRWVNADDVDRLVREIDIALYGSGAAEQAKLCDLAGLVTHAAAKAGRPLLQADGGAAFGRLPAGATAADAVRYAKSFGAREVPAYGNKDNPLLLYPADLARMLAAAPQAPAEAVAPAEDDDEEVWRRLALQFDGHRMRAIGLLKLIDHTLKGGPAFATEKIQGDIARFLSEPPLSGEEVLAERIARAAAPTQEADGWMPIETAPEGEAVLCAVEFDRPGDWRMKAGYLDSRTDAWIVWGASWTPTLWRPLPPPPPARQEGAQHER
ncbi:hypothetical protein [Acidovorax sp. PRC11]|uniref:hypothetical protein n=1 Tax=Acidovorax sp. PRC11 TaxID=2962592 RepID=UPI002881A5B1|nr:hypothetical protein [Acidovorax sp. PRC11]MDT0140172.1 hypothetical protein [Acidovorax sp. PRC11]